MFSQNTLTITGNLVKDPEFKTPKEKTVGTCVIAYNHSKEKVSYFDVEAWEDSSNLEALREAKKGYRVHLTGYLAQERWENAEKKIDSRIKIIATGMVITPNKGNGNGEASAS